MTKRKSQRLLNEATIRRFMKLANTQVLAEDFMDRTDPLEEEALALEEEEGEMEPGEEMPMGDEEPKMDMDAEAPAGEADVDEEVVEDIVSAVVDAISNVTGVEASVEAGEDAGMEAPAEEAGEEMGDAGEEEAAMRDYAANRDDDEELTVEVVDDEELTEAVLQRVVERLLSQTRN